MSETSCSGNKGGISFFSLIDVLRNSTSGNTDAEGGDFSGISLGEAKELCSKFFNAESSEHLEQIGEILQKMETVRFDHPPFLSPSAETVPIIFLGANSLHGFVLDNEKQRLLAFGSNSYDQLGLTDTEYQPSLFVHPFFAFIKISKVVLSRLQTVFLTTGGELFLCGRSVGRGIWGSSNFFNNCELIPKKVANVFKGPSSRFYVLSKSALFHTAPTDNLQGYRLREYNLPNLEIPADITSSPYFTVFSTVYGNVFFEGDMPYVLPAPVNVYVQLVLSVHRPMAKIVGNWDECHETRSGSLEEVDLLLTEDESLLIVDDDVGEDVVKVMSSVVCTCSEGEEKKVVENEIEDEVDGESVKVGETNPKDDGGDVGDVEISSGQGVSDSEEEQGENDDNSHSQEESSSCGDVKEENEHEAETPESFCGSELDEHQSILAFYTSSFACHGFVVTAQHQLLAFGWNQYYQTGIKQEENSKPGKKPFIPKVLYVPTPLKLQQQQHSASEAADNIIVGKSEEEEVVKIACGLRHSLFLLSGNRVLSAGHSVFGQTAQNAVDYDHYAQSPTAVDVKGIEEDITKVTDVACGQWTSFFVFEDGSVKACGRAEFGALGADVKENLGVPVKVKVVEDIQTVVAGLMKTYFLAFSGRVFTTGKNIEDRKGVWDISYVPSELTFSQKVVRVGLGARFGLFLLEDSTLVVRGSLYAGAHALKNEVLARNVKDFAAGRSHVVVCNNLGCFSAGCGKFGRLGLGSSRKGIDGAPEHSDVENSEFLHSIPELAGVELVGVYANVFNSYFKRTDGKVLVTGAGGFGCLCRDGAARGPYSIDTVTVPVLSSFMGGGEDATKRTTGNDQLLKKKGKLFVGAFSSHGFVYTTSQTLYAFGENGDYQLGLGDKETRFTLSKHPTLAFAAGKLKKVSCGYTHTLFMTAEEVWSCGWSNCGQTGQGEMSHEHYVEEPTIVKFTTTDELVEVSDVECGFGTSFFITSSGLVLGCGDGTKGQLGTGGSLCKNESSPTKVKIDEPVQSVSAGMDHTLFLTVEGRVLATGSNQIITGGHGRLGLWNEDKCTVPTEVKIQGGGDVNLRVAQIACGMDYSLFLLAEDNNNRLFKSGNIAGNCHRTPVLHDKDVTAIAAGAEHFIYQTGDSPDTLFVGGEEWKMQRLGLVGKSAKFRRFCKSYVRGADSLQLFATFSNSYFIHNDSIILGCGETTAGQLMSKTKDEDEDEDEEKEEDKDTIREIASLMDV